MTNENEKINTGGGAYINGDVHIHGGDFIGRDRSTISPPREVVVESYAPLLIWAAFSLPLPPRAPRNRALAIHELAQRVAGLPPLPLDVPALPPVCILSLDPTGRVEEAFSAARRDLSVVLTRQNVPPRVGDSLLKLAGDLDSRTGLWLGWDDVQNAYNDPDKVHLLNEARRHAANNAVVVLAQCPGEDFARLWPLLCPLVAIAEQGLVVGPEEYNWPSSLECVGNDPERVLDLIPVAATATSFGPPASFPAAESAVIERLELLLVGQTALKRGQTAIYRRLTDAERRQVASLREAMIVLRETDTAALCDLRGMVAGLRHALLDIRDRQLVALEDDVHAVLQEVTEVLGAGVGIGTELELLLPFLPFLLKVDLGGALDLRQLVEKIMAGIHRSRDKQS